MLGANQAGGAPPQAGDADLAALAQLTKAAGTIEMRFRKAEGDKQFGQGLDKKLVGSVEKDSETFWDDVKGLTPGDARGLSDEDAQDLQKVVQRKHEDREGATAAAHEQGFSRGDTVA